MTANHRVKIDIPYPTITVSHVRRGDIRGMTVYDVLEFARDLEDGVTAGLDPSAPIQFFSTDGRTYGARASSALRRKEKS